MEYQPRPDQLLGLSERFTPTRYRGGNLPGFVPPTSFVVFDHRARAADLEQHLTNRWTAWRTTGRRQDFVEVGTFDDRRHFWRVWRELRAAANLATGFAWKACLIRDDAFPLQRTRLPRLEVQLATHDAAVFEEVWSRAAAALVGERLPAAFAMALFPAQRLFEIHLADSSALEEHSTKLKLELQRLTLFGVADVVIRFAADDGSASAIAFACTHLDPQPAALLTAKGLHALRRMTPEGLLFKRLRALRKKIRSGHELLLRETPPLNSAEREKVTRLAELIRELHLCEEEARLLGIFPAESELITLRDGSDSGSLGHDDDGDGDEALGPDPTEFPSEYREWIKERIRSSTIRHREHMEQIVERLQHSTTL